MDIQEIRYLNPVLIVLLSFIVVLLVCPSPLIQLETGFDLFRLHHIMICLLIILPNLRRSRLILLSDGIKAVALTDKLRSFGRSYGLIRVLCHEIHRNNNY